MLQDKAIENLSAGETLLARGFVDAAASRLYYAMYQAAVSRMANLGIAPVTVQSGAVRWDHAMIAQNTWRLRRRRDDRELYISMMQLRVKADYSDTAVPAVDVSPLVHRVRDFVRELTS
jgi:uncharacterized protein (UPF0332 family)